MISFHKFVFMIVCCSIIFSTSCDANISESEKKLNVIFSEYGVSTELRSAQIDEEEIESWNLIEENSYYEKSCSLSSSNGNIVISMQSTSAQVHLIEGAFDGYFVEISRICK